MTEEAFLESGSFRTTIQVNLTIDQLGEVINFLGKNKLEPKVLHSKWVPDGTPENEGYYKETI